MPVCRVGRQRKTAATLLKSGNIAGMDVSRATGLGSANNRSPIKVVIGFPHVGLLGTGSRVLLNAQKKDAPLNSKRRRKPNDQSPLLRDHTRLWTPSSPSISPA